MPLERVVKSKEVCFGERVQEVETNIYIVVFGRGDNERN